MSSVKILVTGATGLLGTELKKHLEFIGVSSREVDITIYSQVRRLFNRYQPDIVLHLAAYTDVAKAEVEKKKCYQTNVLGTENVARFAKYLIYMSTEYVFDGERGNYKEEDIPNPVNFYSLTKLLGEFEAKRARHYCIIRTLFKPNPFEHSQACVDMFTSGGYVTEIALEVARALQKPEILPPVIHIGTGRKNLFDLAKQTRPDVIPIKRITLPIRLPRDTSLNTRLWEELKKKL